MSTENTNQNGTQEQLTATVTEPVNETERKRPPRNVTIYSTTDFAEKHRPENNKSTKLWAVESDTVVVNIELEDGSRQQVKGKLLFTAVKEDGSQELTSKGYCWSVFAPEAQDCADKQLGLKARGAYARQSRTVIVQQKPEEVISAASPEALVKDADEERLKAMREALNARAKELRDKAKQSAA